MTWVLGHILLSVLLGYEKFYCTVYCSNSQIYLVKA
jgi:hypothetical protein